MPGPDLRPQATRRTPEEMLAYLKSFELELKFSAGVGTGLFGSVNAAVPACVIVIKRTEPDAVNRPRHEEAYGIYRGLYAALRPSMHALAAMP